MNFHVILTGICGYRPSRYGSDRKADELVVFLPRADDPAAILDGQEAVPHYGALFYTTDGETQLKLPVLGYEIEFDLEGAGIDEAITVEQSFEDHVVAMSALQGVAGGVDPRLDRDPAAQTENLWGRVRFGAGSLRTEGETTWWEFLPRFDDVGKEHSQELASRVDLVAKGVEGASVRYRRFGTETWSTLELAPNRGATDDDETICIVLANLEGLLDGDGGISALDRSIGQGTDDSLADLDFRWNYRLVANAASLAPRCGSMPDGRRFAAHPQRKELGNGRGSGPNCYGGRFDP